MARVSTYLNFPGTTEAAFEFYRSVFGGDFTGEVNRIGSIPPFEGMPPISEADKNLIMHIELTILGGHVLMGTDVVESMGQSYNRGDNVHLNLEPDSLEETQRLIDSLSEGGMGTPR